MPTKKTNTVRQRVTDIRFDFGAAIASANWKYDSATTKAMVIERFVIETGHKEVITFSEAYAELSIWLDRAFANISESGLSDMLAETFFQNATIFTKKAEYRLWTRKGH